MNVIGIANARRSTPRRGVMPAFTIQPDSRHTDATRSLDPKTLREVPAIPPAHPEYGEDQ